MKKLLTILLVLLAFSGVKANDGAFYAEGNQLIPITETSIKVQKEVLTITRVPDANNGHGNAFQVNVYYEFFNPGKAKDLIVGFEAPTPSETAFFGTLDEIIPGDKSSFTAEQKRIMKNVPFAYRGYVFEDKGLQRYYNSTKWYVPNPDYKADMTTMSKNEKEWIQFWSK